MSRTTFRRSATDEENTWDATELWREKGTTPKETPHETDPLVNNDWDADPTKETSITDDWIYIIPTLIFLISPWVFFGLVKHRGGVQFSHHSSKWIIDHPKFNNFVFTTISGILNVFIGILSGKAVEILAKKSIVHNGTDILGLSFFTGLKNRSLPPWKCITHWQGFKPFLAMVPFLMVFYVNTSSISALITPGPFTRHATLRGQELDFGASDAECDNWFQENNITNDCSWGSYKGGTFTTCLVENQLVDVLESGRSNILFLKPNASVGVTMTQLGLPFLGPIRGVLPNGPNGIPQFNTLSSDRSPFTASAETGLTYNYTLQLQGLYSNISCAYTPDTPIKYGTLPSPSPWWIYNGTSGCDPGQDFLPRDLDSGSYEVPPLRSSDDHALGFWACGSGQSYTLYLAGKDGYNQLIGNITCTISPIVPAVFPVEYVGQTGLFSSQPKTSASAGTKTELAVRAIKSLGAIIAEAQTPMLNAFAESVLTFGVKSFNQTSARSDTYLRLFEAMIEGILEYQATYIRLLYEASATSPPQKCLRTIDGSVDYQVIGWFVDSDIIRLLIPLTLFNLLTLVMLVRAMCIGNGKRPLSFDPTSPHIFIFRSNQYVPVDLNYPPNWPIKIEHGPTVGAKDGLCLKDHKVKVSQFVAPFINL